MAVGGTYLGAVQPGTILSVDLEEFYVEASTTTGNLTVLGGFNGSTPANHTAGTQAIINDRFPQFSILQAINDDLQDLSSPYNGLGQILYTDVTFNPTYRGYSLGPQFDATSSKILEISYKIAPPWRTYPADPTGRLPHPAPHERPHHLPQRQWRGPLQDGLPRPPHPHPVPGTVQSRRYQGR